MEATEDAFCILVQSPYFVWNKILQMFISACTVLLHAAADTFDV